MIRCTTVRDNISDYIDGTLENSQLVEFEKHICECKDCKCELEEIMFVVNICKDIEEVEPPTDFKAQLHGKLVEAALGDENIKTRKKFSFKKYSGIAASVAVILLAAVLFKDIALGGLLPKADKNMMMSKAENSDIGNHKSAQSAKKGNDTADLSVNDEQRQSHENNVIDSAEGSQASSIPQSIDRYSLAADVTADVAAPVATNVSKIIDLEVVANGDSEVIANINKMGTEFGFQADTNTSTVATLKGESTTSEQVNVITLAIPSTNFDKFMYAIKLKYGESNVKVLGEGVTGFAGSENGTTSQNKENNQNNGVEYTLFNINIVK